MSVSLEHTRPQRVDMFDCVLPTRLARTGTAMTSAGRLVLRRSAYRADPRPLEPGCDCQACLRFSRAYLRHLHVAGEILGHRMVSLHNLHHLGRLMAEVRAAVEADQLTDLISRRRHAMIAGGQLPTADSSPPPQEP